MRVEFQEGLTAYRDGLYKGNPYPPGTSRFQEWQWGFEQGRNYDKYDLDSYYEEQFEQAI
jgi:hypothetical protein